MDCRIKANWDNTPLSYGLSPNVIYPGLKTVEMVNPMRVTTRKLTGTFLHKVDIKIDDVQINMNPFTDEEVTDEENLTWYRTNYVEGIVMNELATTEANVVTWFHGAGNAYKVREASRTCTADGLDCYEARVMPTISSIDHATGYTTGGQELIIEGTSLNMAEPVVTVDGVECIVTEYDFYWIKCITGEKEELGAT